jgi:hypothetical protein
MAEKNVKRPPEAAAPEVRPPSDIHPAKASTRPTRGGTGAPPPSDGSPGPSRRGHRQHRQDDDQA